MKLSVYVSIGDLYNSLDIEFSSDIASDCEQADKFVSRLLEKTYDEVPIYSGTS